MITAFFGDMGSGKTLTMTKYLYIHYLKGWKIYTNYSVSFEHVKIGRKYLETLCTKKQELGENIIFAFDEFDLWNDSRTSMSKSNLYINYFIKQLRKYSAKLFVATQFRHSLDKRLRTLIRSEILCTNKILSLVKKGQVIDINIIYNDLYINGDLKSKKRFCGNRYYELYDTKELITV